MEKNLKDQITETEAKLGKEFEEISRYIFEHPEVGGGETKSCAYLTKIMESHGFHVTCPYGGEATGFRAEFGTGGPVVAFLAEYDALPGYGENGSPAHACGHNWIAATTAGAAIVLSKVMKDLPGRVLLIGTPAEESYGGKIGMIENEGFLDVDVAIQAHLDDSTETRTKALAMTSTTFGFTGKAAHAAQSPHEGINALDAAQLTFAGINALRQHVTPDVRIHGIITDGGAVPNVIPAHSGCEFYVRADSRATAEAITEKLFNCVKGAALMTGAQWNVERQEPVFYDLINIPTLIQLADENLMSNGFRQVHRDEPFFPGSSDIGNVSHVCPTVYMEIGLPGEHLLVHERAALDLVDSEAAHIRLHQVIRAMAGIAADLFLNPKLCRQAWEEYHQAQLCGDRPKER